MSWTEERTATLKRMWEGGATATEIAKELGEVSRNAVIGKAHRLGLKSHDDDATDQPLREYGVGAQIIRELGVRKMVFLSDTKPTRVAGLEGYLASRPT